eukprot:c9638_g1_i1.p1 GENE.c9638_g1_i1~~c9638_g1_i1.p1  ORF type:complete len:225 (-),score=59.64 c9638_g1_i1:223-852(-)
MEHELYTELKDRKSVVMDDKKDKADTKDVPKEHEADDLDDDQLSDSPVGDMRVVFRAAAGFYREWKEFALRKTIFDVTIGLMIGNALSGVTNSLVTDILTPLLIGSWSGTELSSHFTIIKYGKKKPEYYPYHTIAQADADGAVLFKWGRFLDQLFNFFFVTVAIFLMWKLITSIRKRVEKDMAEELKRLELIKSKKDDDHKPSRSLVAP